MSHSEQEEDQEIDLSDFENITMIPKHSSSPTIQYFAEYKGQAVVVKAHLKLDVVALKEELQADLESKHGPNQKITEYCDLFVTNYNKKYAQRIKGIDYENRVYSDIVSYIFEKNISTNFVEFVTIGHAPYAEFVNKFASETFDLDTYVGLVRVIIHWMSHVNGLDDVLIMSPRKRTITPEIQVDERYLLYNYLKHSTIYFLVTKRVLGSENDFKKMVCRSSTLSENELKQVMFQLFFTLYLMQKIRLQHNDLHYHNILIETLPEKTMLSYRVDGKLFEFETQYLLRIYDWDNSFVDDPCFGINEMIEMRKYKSNGILNEIVKNFDYFQIICNILAECDPSGSTFSICNTQFFKTIFSDLIASNVFQMNSNGVITGFADGGYFHLKDCRPTNKEALLLMPELKNLLIHPIFSEFRSTNSSSLVTRRSIVPENITVSVSRHMSSSRQRSRLLSKRKRE